MNKQEFIERTGLTPTNEEYQTIEAIYMAAGEMGKDKFCAEYKKCGTSQLVNTLVKEAKILKGQLEERNNELNDCHEQKLALAEFLIGKAHAHNDTDLYNKAVKMVGQQKATIITITMGLPLWEEDINYIKNNLN